MGTSHAGRSRGGHAWWAMAMVAGVAACSPYTPRIAPPEKSTWIEHEKQLRAYARDSFPMLDTLRSDKRVFDLAVLARYDTSDRHGAGDERRLSRYAGGQVISDGPHARIKAVKGVEYKSEQDFERHPIPIAIIHADSAYAKLGLEAGTNWWIVQKKGDRWVGWIATAKGTVSELVMEPQPTADSLEPSLGAFFRWQSSDEGLWGYCGGKCCSATRISAQ